MRGRGTPQHGYLPSWVCEEFHSPSTGTGRPAASEGVAGQGSSVGEVNSDAVGSLRSYDRCLGGARMMPMGVAIGNAEVGRVSIGTTSGPCERSYVTIVAPAAVAGIRGATLARVKSGTVLNLTKFARQGRRFERKSVELSGVSPDGGRHWTQTQAGGPQSRSTELTRENVQGGQRHGPYTADDQWQPRPSALVMVRNTRSLEIGPRRQFAINRSNPTVVRMTTRIGSNPMVRTEYRHRISVIWALAGSDCRFGRGVGPVLRVSLRWHVTKGLPPECRYRFTVVKYSWRF